jgi:hypothetical protein
MIQAKAATVASRAIPGGTEYLFEAAAPANPAFGDAPSAMKIYVLDIEGQDPVFTRVDR